MTDELSDDVRYVVHVYADGSWVICAPHETRQGRIRAGLELDGGETPHGLLDSILGYLGDDAAARRRNRQIDAEGG